MKAVELAKVKSKAEADKILQKVEPVSVALHVQTYAESRNGDKGSRVARYSDLSSWPSRTHLAPSTDPRSWQPGNSS
jgi:hypothetical protein